MKMETKYRASVSDDKGNILSRYYDRPGEARAMVQRAMLEGSVYRVTRYTTVLLSSFIPGTGWKHWEGA